MKTKGMVFYGACYAALLAATLFGGCKNPSGSSADSPSDSSSGKKPAGNTVEIGIGIDGNLGLTGAGENNVIYTNREPSALTLGVSGEGWTGLQWSIDGRPLGTTETLTIRAADYDEARYTVALTGVRRGTPYAAAIPVTVTRDRVGDLVWTQTARDSSLTSFDLSAWEGDGSPRETWSLTVLEQPVVYFAVRKPARAVITPGNAEGGTVRKAALGETVDGSIAEETLDLFTVRPEGGAVFGEGDCRFTLVVSEPDREVNKTVNVTLAVLPNLTGVAVFHRDGDGNLLRITAANAADHANDLYNTHKSGGFPAWGIDFAHVQNLATALKWLDNYAQSGTPDAWAEYLVRVEEDEAMPKTLISCRMNSSTGILAEYIRIRIRGYGGERKITHDSMNTSTGSVSKDGSGMSVNDAFLCIGPQTDSSYLPNHLEVRLEKNITIDAGSGVNQYFPNRNQGPRIASMIAVSWGNTLVMEAGSKLTNYTYTPTPSLYYQHTAVYILGGGVFELRGGEISNILGHGNLVLCSDGKGIGTNAGPGRFTYYDGVFSGNTEDNVAVGNYYSPEIYPVNDERFKGD
jgi:hypothetical protein